MGMPSLTSLLDFKLDLCTLLISFVQKLLAIPILFYPIPFLKFSKVKGCPRVGPDRVVPNTDSTRSGRVAENQTRNRPPITKGRFGSGFKKRSVGSVETDERRRWAEEDETSSDLVGGERNVADLSLNIAGSKPKLPIWAYTSSIRA